MAENRPGMRGNEADLLVLDEPTANLDEYRDNRKATSRSYQSLYFSPI